MAMNPPSSGVWLPRRAAVAVFLAFALAYFLSALIRAVTATLSPTLTQEFALDAGDLGLLAGGYFLGFSLTQLPLGVWLDRLGPRRVSLAFLVVAVLGCVAFSLAPSFWALLLARVLCGVGVSACLMAPLTGYRRWMSPQTQLRCNSWMLMTGSLGMVAATLPVQWLLPLWGWRPLFWGLAVGVLVAMAVIAWVVPPWPTSAPAADATVPQGYGVVWRHPYFRRLVPMGFFNYGGLVAVQTLWAVPWMIRVAGFTPLQAATGLFAINVCMGLTFWAWGWLSPRLMSRGWGADRLMAWGLPWSLMILLALILAGPHIGDWAPVGLAAYCMASTFVSLAQPAVGQAFPAGLAGRALSAYNLVIFAGVFVVQWGIGLLVDGFIRWGLSPVAAFQSGMGVYLGCCVMAYVFFRLGKTDNPRP